jgi:hypothetical protein
MNQDLVGYLLGSLDPEAIEHIERQIVENPELRLELDRIGRALRPLADDGPDVDPPAGLAERTVRTVLQQRVVEPWVGPTSSGSWRLSDLAVAATILALISVVIFPALDQARQQRLLTECKYNLHSLGLAMESYAQTHGEYYPFFSTSGPLSVTGMSAHLLREGGWVAERCMFVCPASRDHVESIPQPANVRAALADVGRLSSLVPSLGGSYGYPLGVNVRDVCYAPRRDQTAARGLMADRGCRSDEGSVDRSNSPNHGGRGQNVLLPDGHVQFLCSPQGGLNHDNIYTNQHNRVEPGCNFSDTVIAPSDAHVLGQ